MEVHVFLYLIGLGTFGRTFSSLSFAITLEKTTCQRTPWYQSDTLIHAERNHLSFLFAIDQIVVILHRDEAMPAVLLCNIKGFGKLPGGHATRAEVTDFAGAHESVQSIERLFDRG